MCRAGSCFIDNLMNLKDLIAEINAKRTELNDINTQIYNKCAENQQIENQIASSTGKLNSLALQGIHFMNTLNQFSVNNMHANMTSPKILPMVFVNISFPKDSQVSESLDKHGSK